MTAFDPENEGLRHDLRTEHQLRLIQRRMLAAIDAHVGAARPIIEQLANLPVMQDATLGGLNALGQLLLPFRCPFHYLGCSAGTNPLPAGCDLGAITITTMQDHGPECPITLAQTWMERDRGDTITPAAIGPAVAVRAATKTGEANE